MKIFFTSLKQPSLDLPDSKVWHNNLYLPLLDMGHEVIKFDCDLEAFFLLDQEAQQKRRVKFEEQLLERVKKEHAIKPIDLFFSYFYDTMCGPELIREIRSLGIMTVNWYCNASYQLEMVEKISPAYDWCWVPEKFRMDDYRRLGANPLYVQEAANPNIYKPYPVLQKYDVGFVGQCYGNRRWYLDQLYAKGKLDVHGWGPKWKRNPPSGLKALPSKTKGYIRELTGNRSPFLPWFRCHSPLSDEEMVKMYSRCKISLGFSVCDSAGDNEPPILQVRLRDFEAPMSGAFYMTEYFDELSEFFEPGKEIVMYHDIDDLIDKCRYYLTHENERERIRQAGLKRARGEHSWQRRFSDAFEKMGLAGQ